MMNRRHFLQHMAGASALALPSINFVQNLRAAEGQLKKENKSIVIFWMSGGPSHMDLWDVKDPNQTNAGEFKRIKTAASGVEISEVLPTVAEQFKHLAIVRSLSSQEADHNRGTIKMNTGRTPNPVVQYPHIGSLASSQLTSKDLPLPGFIGVGGTAQRIGAGFLGMQYAPFIVQNAGQPPANIAMQSSLGSTDKDRLERTRRRQRLFYEIEDNFAEAGFPHLRSKKSDPTERDLEEAAAREAAGSAAQAHTGVYKKGFDLTVSPLRTVFDVNKEPTSVIDAYGGRANGFGMGCLLARKLIEKGVTAIEIDLGGWDNHGNIFNTIRTGNGPRLDKGMGTLIKELDERGLLKNTVVMWAGEFGRTPRINQNGGRDHWARGWSIVIGGGAIKGGQTYGATTPDGMDVADKPCSIGDVYATLFAGLGLEPSTQIRDNLGRPTAIAEGKPLAGLI